jgi:hypothetical protein
VVLLLYITVACEIYNAFKVECERQLESSVLCRVNIYLLVFHVLIIIKKNNDDLGPNHWLEKLIHLRPKISRHISQVLFCLSPSFVVSPQSRPYSKELAFRLCCQFIVCFHKFRKVSAHCIFRGYSIII